MEHDPLTPGLRAHVEHYAGWHRTPVNRALHFLGIPLAVVSTLGLLSHAAVTAWDGPALLQPNLAWPLMLVAAGWYVRVARAAGLLLWSLAVPCYVAGGLLPVVALAAMMAAAVVLHWVGHFGFEGKPPLLFRTPVAVFEAPAWLLATWAGLTRRDGSAPRG